MRKFCTIALALITIKSVSAQNQQLIDSLLNAVQTSISPKDKAQAYLNIAQQYSSTDSISTVKYATQAMEIADSIGYHEGKMQALHHIGWVTMLIGNFTAAEPYFNQELSLAEKHENPKMKANALNGIAQVNSYLGNTEKALEIFLRSLTLREEVNDGPGIAASHNNIGMLYNQKGNYKEALKHYFYTLEFRREIKDMPNLALASTNVGSVYENMGDYDNALKYQLEAKRIAEEIGNIRVMAMAESNLGHVYSETGQYQKAINHLHESVKLIDQMGNEFFKMYPYMVLGQAYLSTNELEKARKYLKGGIKYAEDAGLLANVRNGAELLSEVEKKAGNYKEAYEAHVLFQQMQDSLNNQELTGKLARQEADYEFQKEKDAIQFENQKELLAKNNEIERSRLLFMVAIALGLMLLITGYIIARARIRSKTLQAETLEKVGAFKESMTGMIAHDLKNPLSVIMGTESERPSTRYMARQMLTLVNNMLDVHKFESANAQLDLASHSLATIITEAMENVRPLLSEKNIQIKQEDQSFQVRVDKDYILRVFINLLTNAIKYSPNNGVIDIHVVHEEKNMSISISDQGPGIKEEDRKTIFDAFQQVNPKASGKVKSTGLGLSFCQLAIQAHGQEIMVDAADNGGARFTFTLPYDGEGAESREVAASSFSLSKADREVLLKVVPKLKQSGLHNSIEIENMLANIKTEVEGKRWVESVITAAYSHNQSYFDELVQLIEKGE